MTYEIAEFGGLSNVQPLNIFFFQANEIARFGGLNSFSSLKIQCVLANYNKRGLGFTFALSYFCFNVLPFCCKRRVVVWHPSIA